MASSVQSGSPAVEPTHDPFRPRTGGDRDLQEIEPAWFVAGVQAALGVVACYCNPQQWMQDAVGKRLDQLASNSLPDPFVPELRTMTEAVFGVSRACWDTAQTAFQRGYLQAAATGGGHGPQSAPGPEELAAAEVRWYALLRLLERAGETVQNWLYARTAGTNPGHRALGLVMAAARLSIRPAKVDFSNDPPSLEDKLASLLLEDLPFVCGPGEPGVDPITTLPDWGSLFDGTLVSSRRALAPLAQQFLLYLGVHLDGTKPPRASGVCTVWAEDFADWALLDVRAVAQAFADVDQAGSPIHEILGRRVVLQGWPWSSLYDAGAVSVGWLTGPPTTGGTDGRPWLRVTVDPWLLPYLCRLGTCYREAEAGCRTARYEAQQSAAHAMTKRNSPRSRLAAPSRPGGIFQRDLPLLFP